MTTLPKQEAVYVHLGPSRAASTFLQTEVFPKFRGIVCFSKRDVEAGEREPAYFAPYLDRLETNFGKRPVVIFHEELTAEPLGAIRILADGVGARIDEDHFQLKRLNASLKDEDLQVLRRMDTRFGCRHKPRQRGFRRRLERGLRDARVAVASLVAATRRTSGQQEKMAIVPPEQLEALQERYAKDWAACLAYVRQDRELLIDPEAP